MKRLPLDEKHRNNTLKSGFVSEFLGTFILIFGGNGSVCSQLLFNKSPDVLSIHIAYGLAVAMGAHTAHKTGGALNPALTVRDIVFGYISPKLGTILCIAQTMGAFFASFCLHMMYKQGYNSEMALTTNHTACAEETPVLMTATTFATFPHESVKDQPFYWILDQILGTGFLTFILCVLFDKNSANKIPASAGPFAAGALVCLIGQAFGVNCAYAINPARDLGPRLYMQLAGWKNVFTCRKGYFLIPIIMPIIGAIAGQGLFNLTIGNEKQKMMYEVDDENELAILESCCSKNAILTK